MTNYEEGDLENQASSRLLDEDADMQRAIEESLLFYAPPVPAEVKTEVEQPQTQPAAAFCGICYEANSAENPLYSLKACTGNHVFCSECFTEDFRSLIEDQNKHADLKCPEFNCEVKPTSDEVKRAVSEATYSKYEQFQNDLKVVLDQETIFCGTPDCKGVLNLTETKNNKLKCIECKRSTCSKCKQPYHGKGSCDKNLDKKFKAALGGVQIHQCPQCSCAVQKNGGCPHMYCGVCQYSWCWTCGSASYNWFHKIQGSGFFCDCVNGLAFGFDVKIHWALRLLLSLLCIAFMPIIGIIAFTVLIFADLGGDKCFFAFNRCIKNKSRCCLIFSSPFIIVWYTFWYLFVLALFVSCSTLVVALAVIPAYVLLFAIFIIIPIRFLCCPKRKQSKKQKALLEKKMEEKRVGAARARNNKISKFRR